MSKKHEPKKSTLTAPPTEWRATDDPITALWAPAVGTDIKLPDVASYTIGREREDADVVLSHFSVSRRHAQVRREEDGPRLTDLGSKNGVTVDGARVTSVTLKPMHMIKVGQVPVWPLTSALLRGRQRLAYYLGYAAETGTTVVDILTAAHAGRSFVVAGDASREVSRVVETLIAASNRRAAPRRDVTVDNAPQREDQVRDLASGLQHAVVTVDLDVLARAGERACDMWQTTLADPKWDLMVVWHGQMRMPNWVTMPRVVTIPPMVERAKLGELRMMVGHVMKEIGVGWTIDDLARVGLPEAGLRACPWKDGHVEFRLMIEYGAGRLSGQTHTEIARALGIDRGRLTRLVERWGGGG
jgi:hypothetical protein